MTFWTIAICTAIGVMCCSASAADKDHPHGFEPKFADKAAWEKRANFLRHQVLVAQGLWPMPPKEELKPVVHGRIEREGYTIEKVYFASLPGHYVTGNLYRPTGKSAGKRPVVLMPYGHWPNGRFIWNDDAAVKKANDAQTEKIEEAARSPLQANCVQLARMGCIVFHYDMVGYGDSTKITHREGFQDVEAVLRLQSFMGLQTWNSIRALDFVLGLADVDPARVAVTGSSGGGTQTTALAAVDDRVRVVFPMVMVSMNMQGGCVCENAPLYRVNTNNVELACLVAPKPHGAASANDWTHDFLTRGLPEMRTIWKLYGAEDRVFGMHVNAGHNHNMHSRRAQYEFLNKHLKLGLPEPIEEKPFEPVPSKELSVYDEQHPRPSDETDAATIRKWMTQASDEQVTKMSREDLMVALKAMVVDELPEAEDVVRKDDTILRRNTGERVETQAHDPKDAENTIIISAGGMTVALKPDRRGSTRTGEQPGFYLGYNRSDIAQRTSDLLTAIAYVRCASKRPVDIAATGADAPAAFLASLIAGDAVNRSQIDLNPFQFDQMTQADAPGLLPGALKYRGVPDMARLWRSEPRQN